MIILEKKGKISFALLNSIILLMEIGFIIFFWPLAIIFPILYGGAIVYLNILYDKFVTDTEKRNKYVEDYAKKNKLEVQSLSKEDYDKLLKGESLVLKNGIVITKEDVKYI